MKRHVCLLVIISMLFSSVMVVNAEEQKDIWETIGDGLNDAWSWTQGAANDAWNWTSGAAGDAWSWVSGAAVDAWNWTADTATGAWGGVQDFFSPPSTLGNPNIAPEPTLPDGVNKMYLGYNVTRTGLDNGYSNTLEINRDDPHFGINIGKFYVSGFSAALSGDGNSFVFLKTVGDNLELHFELSEDIDMVGGDSLVTINRDVGGYDKYFGIAKTDMGRGTLIVRHIDYQNNPGKPQVYTDYLAAKMTGSADTIISLNEEGDYEVALDYEIKKDSRILGTAATVSNYTNYRLYFRFSVRNGNCMVFPFDTVTKEELKNTAVTENGFYLDLAFSRYLDINVKLSVLTNGVGGMVEDVRFNRPASDGDKYTQSGIYTITVSNRYTGEHTTKYLYVGTDEKLIAYINQGYSIEQIINSGDGK